MTVTRRLAFVAPRFPESGTVGGAETLLKNLALRCRQAGHKVDFLTTCATNHFSWANEVPAGSRDIEGITVHFFPVNHDRDEQTFLRIQSAMSQGGDISRSDEEAWLRNSVNSDALQAHLSAHRESYHAVLAGPYLFGITEAATRTLPEKTFLIPCLHDEPFAYLSVIHDMFHRVRGSLFNTDTEQRLAHRLYDLTDHSGHVVGMGLDPFDIDATTQSTFLREHHLTDMKYLLFCGRREPLKGTPVLTHYLDVFRKRTQRDVRLVMTGSGDIEAPDDLLPVITDLGFVSEKDKQTAMTCALAFCHPSPNESLGIVLLEAWLAGTPGLVTAASEVLVDQCRKSRGGLWFRNYPEFERELLLLVDKPDIASTLGTHGKAYVQSEYNWRVVEKRLFAALES